MDIKSLVEKYSQDTTTMFIQEMIFVIVEYIKVKKGVNIILNPPVHHIQVAMLIGAFNTAFDYYCLKHQEEICDLK